MKLLVLSQVNGDIDLINEYALKTKCDAVLCAGGLGIYYRFDETKNLPKKVRLGNFHEYMGRYKYFTVPVFTVRGSHDNHSLVDRIIRREIRIPNFNIIDNGETAEFKSVKIGGLGGTFSPVSYNKDRLTGYKKRHFSKNQVEKLKKKSCDILLMYDLIGECNARQVTFSSETDKLFTSIKPHYCFVGKYNWSGFQKIPLNTQDDKIIEYMAVVMLENSKESYLVLDTETWDAEVISLMMLGIHNDNEGVAIGHQPEDSK